MSDREFVLGLSLAIVSFSLICVCFRDRNVSTTADKLTALEASVAAVKARLDAQDVAIQASQADAAKLQAIIDQLNTLANPPAPQPPTTG
jgi:outer membrane murein-binding lipoprotein Lpp